MLNWRIRKSRRPMSRGQVNRAGQYLRFLTTKANWAKQ